MFATETWQAVVALDEVPFLSTVPGTRGAVNKAQRVSWAAYANPSP